MREGKHSRHRHGGPDGEHVHLDPGPYWKRAHQDWRFWIGVFLMFAAITIYFMTVDLSVVPHIHAQPRPSANSIVP